MDLHKGLEWWRAGRDGFSDSLEKKGLIQEKPGKGGRTRERPTQRADYDGGV